MKSLKKLFVLVVLVMASSLFVNCSSNNSSSSSYYLKCKVNGTLVQFDDPYVINSMSKSLTASSESNGKVISLYFPLGVTTGTFSITDEPSNVNAYGGTYSDFKNDEYSANEIGTVTITEVNANVIKGTFSFTGVNNNVTYTITEGEFKAENIQ